MAISNINFNIPGSIVSVYEGESKTALEAIAILTGKTNECINQLNTYQDYFDSVDATAIIEAGLQNLVDTNQLGYINNDDIDALF